MSKHEIVTPEDHLPAWLYLHEQNAAAYIEPHWHSSVEISYTIDGHIANFFIDGQSYTTSPGTILVVNTMEVHSIRTFHNPNIEQKALTVIFPYHIIKNYRPDINDYHFAINDPSHFTNDQQVAYQQLQEKLLALSKIYTNGNNLRKTILLLEILDNLLNHFLEKSALHLSATRDATNKERIQDIKAYIEENFRADIDLDDIANHCFLSKEYLSRFFKESTGVTVFQYVNYTRAKHAHTLLCETKETATKIAVKCGFSGLRTMDRALLKIYGVASREIKTQERQ